MKTRLYQTTPAQAAPPGVGEEAPIRQLDALRDFINIVDEWAAKYPLEGPASDADYKASTEIYAYCEGAHENLYEIRQFLLAGAAPQGTPTTPEGCTEAEARKQAHAYIERHGVDGKFSPLHVAEVGVWITGFMAARCEGGSNSLPVSSGTEAGKCPTCGRERGCKWKWSNGIPMCDDPWHGSPAPVPSQKENAQRSNQSTKGGAESGWGASKGE